MSKLSPGRYAISFVGLLLFWFALAGEWDFQHLALGIPVVAVALAVRRRAAPASP